jgi:hypothetical protein
VPLAVNVMGLLAVAAFGLAPSVTCKAPTMTVVESDPALPVASNAVAVAMYWPELLYACGTVVATVMAPRSLPWPSPKSTWTLETFAPVVGVTVKTTGVPVVTTPVGDVCAKDARPRAFTDTVNAVLVTAPTVAVTFDVAFVVSVAVAVPVASVLTVVGEIDP